MKVGVVSDAHNNVRALAYALEHLADCQVVLNLGDLVFEYRVETEIVEIARRAGLIGIVGNHEKAILQHPGSSVRKKVPADVLDYLKALPASRTMAIEGFNLLIAQARPGTIRTIFVARTCTSETTPRWSACARCRPTSSCSGIRTFRCWPPSATSW